MTNSGKLLARDLKFNCVNILINCSYLYNKYFYANENQQVTIINSHIIILIQRSRYWSRHVMFICFDARRLNEIFLRFSIQRMVDCVSAKWWMIQRVSLRASKLREKKKKSVYGRVYDWLDCWFKHSGTSREIGTFAWVRTYFRSAVKEPSRTIFILRTWVVYSFITYTAL